LMKLLLTPKVNHRARDHRAQGARCAAAGDQWL
jgi:hypothetical protein